MKVGSARSLLLSAAMATLAMLGQRSDGGAHHGRDQHLGG